MIISKEDQERIASAVRSAEAKTSGEIVCVLTRASVSVTALPVFIAAAAALVTPWLLTAFTATTVQRIISLQGIVFLVLLAFLCLPRVRVALMPRRARRAVAHRVAMEQFISRGLAGNKDHSGILIFVSLAEHYARIIADDGIASRVPQRNWQKAIDALIAQIRDDRIADGFVAAIDLCGRELEQHFPQSDEDRNKLPDRIYVM